MDSGETEAFEEQYMQGDVKAWIYTVKTPIRDKEGNIIGVLGIFSDITDRKRAEEAICREREFTETMLESLPGLFTFTILTYNLRPTAG